MIYNKNADTHIEEYKRTHSEEYLRATSYMLIWLARDKDGTLHAFCSSRPPYRYDDKFVRLNATSMQPIYKWYLDSPLKDVYWDGIFTLNSECFPEVTWENSPLQIYSFNTGTYSA